MLGDSKQQPGDVLAAKGSQRYADLITPAGLREVATYADGIGPSLRMVIPLDAQGKLGTPTSLVRDAHAAGLMVVPYTFRPENSFQAAEFRSGEPNARNAEGSVAEMRAYLATGIDAFFTDDPALGRRAVDGDGTTAANP